MHKKLIAEAREMADRLYGGNLSNTILDLCDALEAAERGKTAPNDKTELTIDEWIQRALEAESNYDHWKEDCLQTRTRLAEVERERDALVVKATEDIQKSKEDGGSRCHACAYVLTDPETKSLHCRKWPTKECFKWRGLEDKADG